MVTRLESSTSSTTVNTNSGGTNFVSFKKTSGELYCLWCRFKIDDDAQIVGCPVNRVERGKYDTYGIFCSFNCAKAFALDNCKKPQFMHSVRLLKLMYNENRDTTTENIVESPNPIIMRRYGGFISEEQYRNAVGKILYEEKCPISFNWVNVPFEEFR